MSKWTNDNWGDAKNGYVVNNGEATQEQRHGTRVGVKEMNEWDELSLMS